MEYISHALLFLFLLGIAYEIHALAFSCDTTFLNHPQFCPVTTENKTNTDNNCSEESSRGKSDIHFWHLVSTGMYLEYTHTCHIEPSTLLVFNGLLSSQRSATLHFLVLCNSSDRWVRWLLDYCYTSMLA